MHAVFISIMMNAVVMDVDFISHEELTLGGLEFVDICFFFTFAFLFCECFYVSEFAFLCHFHIFKLQKYSALELHPLFITCRIIFMLQPIFALFYSDISLNAGIFKWKTTEMFFFLKP